MDFRIRLITEADAQQITGWRYEPPYSFYELSRDDVEHFLDPAKRYFSVTAEEGTLVGYCCFGLDARVFGGYYEAGEPKVLDVGVGLRPDWTGRGLGQAFVAAVLDFADEAFSPSVYRATVAEFNRRSRRVFEALGFRVTCRFERPSDRMAFLQLERVRSHAPLSKPKRRSSTTVAHPKTRSSKHQP